MNGFENAILLALVAIIPLVVLTLTSFVKVSVVLSLLRNAIGAPDAPSGLVVTGLSLVLTFFVMAPVAIQMTQAAGEQPAQQRPAPQQIPAPGPAPAVPTNPHGGAAMPTNPHSAAWTPIDPHAGVATPTDPHAGAVTANPHGVVTAGNPHGGATGPTATTATTATPTNNDETAPTNSDGTASTNNNANAPSLDDVLHRLVPAQYQPHVAAAERALGPLRAFLAKHTREADRETFAALSTKLGNQTRGDELWVLAPAFITTELREAFAIAILIFVPFLVIDLIVGLGLASLGLQMTNPQTIALPLKLALFVAVDGWRLLLEALLRGYA